VALNAQERAAAARSVLECFGENAEIMGRFLAFLQVRAGITLLADVVTQSNTWAPFIASGLSIVWWQGEVTRYRDLTLAQIA
jgi:hypothetical protein